MIPKTIIQNLLTNEEYCRKVIHHVKPEFFSDKNERLIFEKIFRYIVKYDSIPKIKEVASDVSEDTSISEDVCDSSLDYLGELDEDYDSEGTHWLVENTESWCKDRAVYNAIKESISIVEGDTKKPKTIIPEILREALSVSFDSELCYDYFEEENIKKRFQEYKAKEDRIPFPVDIFTKITNGGLKKKTLNVLLTGTNVGKTLVKSYMAHRWALMGYNVLYLTAEEDHLEIAKRMDASLLSYNINALDEIPSSQFQRRLSRASTTSLGKLMIRQFPTSTTSANQIHFFMQELALKKKFKPDILILDYLNIFTSDRIKLGGSVNSYTLVKYIAEELRALAIKYDIPILTSAQTNRGGQTSMDMGFDDVGESHGLSQTADLVVGGSSNEDLERQNLILWKQIKSRYGKKSKPRKFVTGIDVEKMTIMDVNQDNSAVADEEQHHTPTVRFNSQRHSKNFDKLNV